jgi:hypothetical protein
MVPIDQIDAERLLRVYRSLSAGYTIVRAKLPAQFKVYDGTAH